MLSTIDSERDFGSACDGGRGACLARLATTGDVRILRRFQAPDYRPITGGAGTRLGLVVDVETTGLRPGPAFGDAFATDDAPDEIIELAAVPFTYGPEDGAVVAVHEPYKGLRQPSKAIPETVKRITGLDDETVRGHAISREDIEAVVPLGAVDLVLSHNARFDRSFLCAFEPLAASFADKPWACTIDDAEWFGGGIGSAKLEFLAAMGFGLFYPPHRAEVDCLVLVEILGRTFPGSDETVLARILRSARRGRHRVRAIGAPFVAKDRLKARGYRWDVGGPGRPKCWYTDVVDEDAAAAERTFLVGLGTPLADVHTIRLNASTRFA